MMFKKKYRTLKIQGDEGISTLYPGDTYELTARMESSLPGMVGEVVIKITYKWDGETLRRKPF
jgi:hypothetical protein